MLMLKKNTERPWNPLLGCSDARSALFVVNHIYDELHARYRGNQAETFDPPGLVGGFLGLGLLAHEMYKGRGGGAEAVLLRDLADGALRTLRTRRMNSTFFHGLAGYGWWLHRVREALDSERQAWIASCLEEIDSVLLARLEREHWMLPFEPSVGLIGYGLHALERGASDGSARRILHLVQGHLLELATSDPDGQSWRTPYEHQPESVRGRFPHGSYNLGMAHGVPAVIAFLAKCHRRGLSRPGVPELLRSSAAWLWVRRSEDRASLKFPSFYEDHESFQGEHRLGWCYGDLGVASALLQAGRALGDSGLVQKAEALAMGCAALESEDGGVWDAGLCHGAAGVAHQFARLYQATHCMVFRDASRGWFQKALDSWRPGLGVGGFRTYYGVMEDGSTRWLEDDIGLGTGAAGIGLALWSAGASQDPGWDHFFLLGH